MLESALENHCLIYFDFEKISYLLYYLIVKCSILIKLDSLIYAMQSYQNNCFQIIINSNNFDYILYMSIFLNT
jgi:hypothetical protein